MARFASGSTDEALDLVQDAMVSFVKRYAQRPPQEWSTLFYRILQSRITDWHRRTLVRRRVLTWLGRGQEGEDEPDPIQSLADPTGANPLQDVLRYEKRKALEKAIEKLPLRQQQAFLLRAWSGMDTIHTALAMRCSEGSVKTHYSRAIRTLRKELEDIRP